MPSIYLSAQDLVIETYRGSPISFSLTPYLDGNPITNLSSYTQIEFSVWSGTRDNPIAEVLTIKYTGAPPNYITVFEPEPGIPAIKIDIPKAPSLALPVGQYFAELLITPPGGTETFTGWAYWNHNPTTIA